MTESLNGGLLLRPSTPKNKPPRGSLSRRHLQKKEENEISSKPNEVETATVEDIGELAEVVE